MCMLTQPPSQIARRMREYRAYFVGEDGHFMGFEPLICRDDGEALAKARRLLDIHDIEVWNCERFVLKLEALPPCAGGSLD